MDIRRYGREGLIGIFDSGVGGFNSYYEVRRALPRADIAYLADREHAPYGTKSKDELIGLVKNDIKRLKELGARAILIACCTASTLYPILSEQERRISIPIIRPAAERAAEGRRVTVIATDATVRSHSFSREISALSPSAEIEEISAQPLVSAVERGARSGCLSSRDRDIFDSICTKIKETQPDTLVLGCTHFSHLHAEFEREFSGVRIVSPAREGARELILRYKNENLHLPHDSGRTVYL